jgi:hypothetical protein
MNEFQKRVQEIDVALRNIGFHRINEFYAQGVQTYNYEDEKGFGIHMDMGEAENVFGEVEE